MSDSDSHTDTTAAFMASLMSNIKDDQTITDHGEGDSLLTLHNEKKEEEKSPETSPTGIKGVLKHEKSRRKKRTRKANPTEQLPPGLSLLPSQTPPVSVSHAPSPFKKLPQPIMEMRKSPEPSSLMTPSRYRNLLDGGSSGEVNTTSRSMTPEQKANPFSEAR
ncbi:hypothetical protein TrLO_g110 [Triparma laevis f. longispina]|uniref:Uncharacterized protein n=1 Tax=Triparma laevis f. longispina TaxID=1714387 RepID=A0A9W7F6R4_9STRA|nr:hypothetical protein TrLO_g110 [Triparma laevis f. longispina]